MELFVEYAAFIILAVLVLGGIGYLGLPRDKSASPSAVPSSGATAPPSSSGAKPKPS